MRRQSCSYLCVCNLLWWICFWVILLPCSLKNLYSNKITLLHYAIWSYKPTIFVKRLSSCSSLCVRLCCNMLWNLYLWERKGFLLVCRSWHKRQTMIRSRRSVETSHWFIMTLLKWRQVFIQTFFCKKKSKTKQKLNKQATYIYTGFTKVPVYKMVLCGDVVRMFQINWRFSYFLERINHLKPFGNVWNVHFHNVCTRVTFLSLFKVKVEDKGVKHKVWWLEFAQQRPQSGPLDDFGKCEEEHSLQFFLPMASHITPK